ncbi:hypothetical protein E1176_18915 [Fulvivirga sp. RKSG066]|nr:hypothetical protein [Fulvivirga aurantia]
MPKKQMIGHIGIDYGSKLAGTTAICFADSNNKISIGQSANKQDADRFIIDFCQSHKPSSVYIDAPLSLPAVYKNPAVEESNFFYRQADIEARAMSPLFLGGLTARAMKLNRDLKSLPFYEVYPKLLVTTLDLKVFYKKDITHFLEGLFQKIHLPNLPQCDNWHQVDALLAFISGIRHVNKQHISIGTPSEGVIFA